MHRARIVRAGMLAACVAGAVLGSWPTIPSGAAARARTVIACRPTWLRTSVAASSTSTLGSGLLLTETNVSTSTCRLLSPLVVRLLGRSGHDVVRAVATPSFAPGAVLPSSYQGVLSVSIHAATICRRRPVVTSIRVTSGTATSVVHLGLPLAACLSRAQPLTVSKVSFPHPAPCRNGALAVVVGWPNGTAGTIYYGIRFSNAVMTACTVHGIPTVLPIDAEGRPAGPAARPERLADRTAPVVLGVRDGVTAWASFGVVVTGNFAPSACASTVAQGIRVTLPGYVARDLPLAFSLCTRLTSTTIEGVAPGWLSQ